MKFWSRVNAGRELARFYNNFPMTTPLEMSVVLKHYSIEQNQASLRKYK